MNRTFSIKSENTDNIIDQVENLRSKYPDCILTCDKKSKGYFVRYEDDNPDHYAALRGCVPGDEAIKFLINKINQYHGE